MCGIAGAIEVTPAARPRESVARAVLRMRDQMGHRGPDAAGAWSDPAAEVHLAHRRLSIVDLSGHASQPMAWANGRFHIVFNGEIYNFKDLARDLAAAGHSLTSTGDTQVLVAAVAEWGLERAVQRIVGMFAFAIWDRQEQVLHLARDRMGEKPLHVGVIDGILYFSSELRSFRFVPGFSSNISRKATTSYLRFGYIPEPLSIYEGVFKLPPGTTLSVRYRGGDRLDVFNEASANPSTLSPRRYWSARDVALSARDRMLVDEQEAMGEFERLLRQAVRHQSLCDVPIGCFLSGGIDSSLVAAVMQAESAAPIHTFTIGFDKPEFDESAQALAIANHLGARHERFLLTGAEVMSGVPDLVPMLDEPTANGSVFAAQRVSLLARTKSTVVLSGDGGDELFAGYNRYRLTLRAWSKVRWVPGLLRRALGAMLSRIDHQGLADRRGILMALTPLGSQASAASTLAKIERLLQARSFKECYDLIVSCWSPGGDLVRGRSSERAWEDLPGISSLLLSDQLDYLPGDNLAKLDRASMSVSLETRLPLLDHRIVEFSWRVPQSMKLRGGTTKWLMRAVLEKFVPASLTDRRKMGFTVPLHEWLSGPLRDWANDGLTSKAFKELMEDDHAKVMKVWEGYRSRGRPSSYQVWALAVLGAWVEHSTRATEAAAMPVSGRST